jgi:hypothetical protein
MANYDWIIALSIILFPLGLAIGLLLRHQRRLDQTGHHNKDD